MELHRKDMILKRGQVELHREGVCVCVYVCERERERERKKERTNT